MMAGSTLRLNPQRQLWLAVGRHTPWVWLALGCLLMLSTGVFVSIALDRSYHGPAARRPALDTLMPAMLIISGIGFATAAMLVATWLRVLRGGFVVLRPGGQAIAARAAVVQIASLWFLVSLPLMIIVAILNRGVEPSVNSSLLWIQALGWPALGMAAAAATLTLGKLGFWLSQALFWCLMGMVVSIEAGLLLLDPVELHRALSVLGIMGFPSFGWILLHCHRRLFGQDAIASDLLDDLSSMAKIEYQAPAGAGGLFRLGAADLLRPWHQEALSLFVSLGLLVLFINPYIISWAGPWVLAWSVLPLALLSQSMWLLPMVNPRLALLPGGWHRQTSDMRALLKRVWPWLLNRLDLATLGMACLLVSMSSQSPWQQALGLALALALAVFAVRLWSGCLALATMPITHSFAARFAVNLAAPLPLAAGVGLTVLADWLPTQVHPASWLAQAAILLAVAVVLGWLLLFASRRAWQRMDWARQPVSPLLVGQPRLT